MKKLKDILKRNITEQEIIRLTRLLVESPSHHGIDNQKTNVANIIRDFFINEGISVEYCQ